MEKLFNTFPALSRQILQHTHTHTHTPNTNLHTPTRKRTHTHTHTHTRTSLHREPIPIIPPMKMKMKMVEPHYTNTSIYAKPNSIHRVCIWFHNNMFMC